MNLHRANSICRWYAAQYAKEQQAVYEKAFPESEFRFPTPTFFLVDLEQCVEFIERITGNCLRASSDSELTATDYWDTLLQIAEKNAKQNGMSENWEREYVSGAAKCRFVVAAANRYGDLITAVGARHGSPVMWQQLSAIREEKLIDLDNKGKAEQGFIDQFDVFMTREEAWDVAVASGQLNLRRYCGYEFGRLYSEDVW